MVKCYTKMRKDGTPYKTCNSDIKENQGKATAKPKKPTAKKKMDIFDELEAELNKPYVPPKKATPKKAPTKKAPVKAPAKKAPVKKAPPKKAPVKAPPKKAPVKAPSGPNLNAPNSGDFLKVLGIMSNVGKENKLEKFKVLTIEDLRSGLRKYAREKNIRQKGINNASRESMEKYIQEKNVPFSYFKKGGVNRVDIDDILNEAVKFTKDYEKENKSKIIKAILKARAEGREDSGIEYQIDRNYSTRGKIKQAIRNANNSLSNFKYYYLRAQQERFDA